MFNPVCSNPAGFRNLSVLSFNMNILPFGVASIRGHESLHSSARLQTFLQKIRQELEAEASNSKAAVCIKQSYQKLACDVSSILKMAQSQGPRALHATVICLQAKYPDLSE